MKHNRKKWKQIWKTKPQPKHHNTEDFMYYDMNEMEAWLWQLIKHDEGFEKELREVKIALEQPFEKGEISDWKIARHHADGQISIIKDILGEVE